MSRTNHKAKAAKKRAVHGHTKELWGKRGPKFGAWPMIPFFKNLCNRIDRRKNKPVSALEDAYEIHSDGQARMIPERLVQREQFQKNLKVIKEMDI